MTSSKSWCPTIERSRKKKSAVGVGNLSMVTVYKKRLSNPSLRQIVKDAIHSRATTRQTGKKGSLFQELPF